MMFGGEMDKNRLVRRTMHAGLALAPLYYLLPVDLPVVNLRRWVLLIAFIVAILLFEVIRLRKGIVFLGLRPHEKNQIASFVWAAAGVTFVLWLFPHDVASAVLIGMAFVDPLSGELRLTKIGLVPMLVIAMLVYFSICAATLLLAGDRSFLVAMILSVAGTLLAVGSEQPKIPYIDDDFLMLTVPAIGMGLLLSLM